MRSYDEESAVSKKTGSKNLWKKKHQDSSRLLVARATLERIESLWPDKFHHFSEDALASFLVEPPQASWGDLALGCFSLAMVLELNPAQAALKLKESFSSSPHGSFKQVTHSGPYLNFTLSESVMDQEVLRPILMGTCFSSPIFEGAAKTMIEFSQPNTHKELHVGHLRNLCLGDALVKIFRSSGFEVISSTFPGDLGTHVAKCLWYLKNHVQEPWPTQRRGEWLGKIYSKAHLKLEDEDGSPRGESNRAQITAILRELESEKGPYYELWKETRSWSIELMKEVYQWAGVEFDRWYWESEVDRASVEYVKSLFEEGKLILSQGAVGLDLESEGLGFCMFLKSDGTGLYATKDLELARRKFQDFGIEHSVYVVDQRQALHFKQIFRTLEVLGFEKAKNCFHLQYNFVELPDGAMSSRKGNIVPFLRLVEEMKAQVEKDFLHRYRGEWSEDEIHRLADQIAQGAIKYGMLRMDTQKKIVFHLNDWLKIEGESGPFIQYSQARINSLLEKFGPKTGSAELLKFELVLKTDFERHLASKLIHFQWVLSKCVENCDPSGLCTYLYDLAKLFNRFYHECPIGTETDENLKLSRLKLCASVGVMLRQGLSRLGIPSPKRM